MTDIQTSIRASIIGTRPDNYAGDVSVDEAWRVLQQDQNSLLIDVRTKAEWAFVGGPDLSSAGKEVVRAEWQSFPTMELNSDFLTQVKTVAATPRVAETANLFVICRSGARSKAAAIALTAAGFQNVHNVAGGFEGDLNSEQRRGMANGWKAGGLPWCQS